MTHWARKASQGDILFPPYTDGWKERNSILEQLNKKMCA